MAAMNKLPAMYIHVHSYYINSLVIYEHYTVLTMNYLIDPIF